MKDDFVFPRTGSGAPGMELRDWFAGMALQGFVARMNDATFEANINSDWEFLIGDAYDVADAMMEARNKEQN